jgi:hypothetical protein
MKGEEEILEPEKRMPGVARGRQRLTHLRNEHVLAIIPFESIRTLKGKGAGARR